MLQVHPLFKKRKKVTTYLVYSFNQFRLDAYALNPVVGVISPVISADQGWLSVSNATAGQKKSNKTDHLVMLPVCVKTDVQVLDFEQYNTDEKN